ISQVNSRTFNEAHWNNLMWIMNQAKKHPRPLNHTKIYSAGNTSWGSGTPKDGVERFWRNLIAGSASCRFHRPGGGIGLNDTAKACIRAARKVEKLINFWEVEPRVDLLSNREEDEAYLAAKSGVQYMLYFTDGGSVRLNLKGHSGKLQLHWIEIRTGSWGDRTTISGDKVVTINAPDKGPWVAVIVRQ
ncbi:MAG: putative collagen-binding domain-containing protein, partial [Planctomycetota bacterium]